MDITLENYEFAFFQYEEGLLTPEERQEVEAFCQEHPALGEELQLAMECPKLEPLDVATPAPNVETGPAPSQQRMAHPSLRRGRPRLYLLRGLSAAACVGLLIGIGVQLWGPSAPNPHGSIVAETHNSPKGATDNSPGRPNPGIGSRPKGATDFWVREPWVGNTPNNQRPVGAQEDACGVAPLQGASSVGDSVNPGFSHPVGVPAPWAIVSDPVGVHEPTLTELTLSAPDLLYADNTPTLNSQLSTLNSQFPTIQQVDSEEFQLLLAQNYIEATEMLALSADEPAPKSEEELSHPIATWLARQKEAALMQLAEFFTQKFNH